jgi:hypothetical protein
MSKHVIPSLIIAVAILTGGIIGRSTAAIPVESPEIANIVAYQAKMLSEQIRTNLLLTHMLELEQQGKASH